MANAWEPDLYDAKRQTHTDGVIAGLKTMKFSNEYHNDDNEWNNEIIARSSNNAGDKEPGLVQAKKADKKAKKAAKKAKNPKLSSKKAKKGGKKDKKAKKAKKAKK